MRSYKKTESRWMVVAMSCAVVGVIVSLVAIGILCTVATRAELLW